MARRVYPTSASDAKAKVDFSGPFFTPAGDASLRQNIRAMLRAVADEGERAVEARSPRVTGAFIGGIQSRSESGSGKPWALSAVVSATHIYPWHQHVSATISRRESGGRRASRRGENRQQAEYRGGKLEAKFHMFRNVAGQLRRSRAVLAANLTKGIE